MRDQGGINVLSAGGSFVGAIVGLTPIGAIAISPANATITTMKIVVDVQNGRSISPGDILGVTGSAIAFIGGVGVLAAGAATAPLIGLTAAALGLGLAPAPRSLTKLMWREE